MDIILSKHAVLPVRMASSATREKKVRDASATSSSHRFDTECVYDRECERSRVAR